MAETELTKKIKQACVHYNPKLPSKMRTIRYAYEVQTPNGGFVDAIRFEDYIKEKKSVCNNPGGFCKIPNQVFPNISCHGCVWKHNSYILDIMTTCFEVKISVSDFKSSHGHNFYGNENYYVIDSRIYNEVKDLVPEDIGILVFYEKTNSIRKKKDAAFKEISESDTTFLMYNALKKWCDGKMQKGE